LGARLHLHSADSDATLRALLAAFPSAHDIEVTPTWVPFDEEVEKRRDRQASTWHASAREGP